MEARTVLLVLQAQVVAEVEEEVKVLDKVGAQGLAFEVALEMEIIRLVEAVVLPQLENQVVSITVVLVVQV